jgi:RNA polymerase sigma-70 factor (ECF subfamily)
MNSLTQKSREVFVLSRFNGLKYREIAEKLDISIKTVETHMSVALKHLRKELKDYQ